MLIITQVRTFENRNERQAGNLFGIFGTDDGQLCAVRRRCRTGSDGVASSPVAPDVCTSDFAAGHNAAGALVNRPGNGKALSSPGVADHKAPIPLHLAPGKFNRPC